MQLITPRVRKWSRSDYYRMAEMGLFEGERVELIDGEVIDMPPQRNEHFVCVELVKRQLESVFGGGYWIRTQGPLNLFSDSAPEPDVAVIDGDPRDFKAHPSTALLIVEVSDTSLVIDLEKKPELYARAMIQEYWILNLVEKTLVVHRKPVKGRRGKSKYLEVKVLGADDLVSPLAAPRKKIKVAEMLI